MISSTIYYVPNLMNYARVIIIICMLAKMRTRPFTAFILCLVSGMINWYDGTIARYLDQTSRFGHIMDMSLDRLTNSAQMVTLALFYPNYWLFFFSVLSVDTIRDFSKVMGQYHQFLVSSAVHNSNTDLLKDDIFKRLGLSVLKVSPVTQKKNPNIELFEFIVTKFYKYVWFSSDLYFWLLYFNRFIKGNCQESICSSNLNLNLNCSKNVTNKARMINFLFLDSLRNFLEEKLAEFFAQTPKILCYFKGIFRVFVFFLILGAFLKFYFNIRDLMDVFLDIIKYDDQLNYFKSININIS